MKLKCRIGLHEIDWDDKVLRDIADMAVQRGECRHCGIIRQRRLGESFYSTRSCEGDEATRATGPLPRIKL